MRGKQDIVASMFLPAAFVMIFTLMTGVAASIIDGIITSRFLGSDAYAAVSLLGPLASTVLLISSFISIGGQVVCSQKAGTGQRDEADAVFTFSAAFGLTIALLFMMLCFFSHNILFRICGVSMDERPELYGCMLSYLHGYLIGIPAFVMVQVLSPFLVMDNGKKLVSLSSIVLCVSDVAGDLVNILVFRGGVFGMGLATSISMWLQLGVLSMHFVRRAGYFRFSLKALKHSHLKGLAENGALTFVRELASVLRDLAVNRINLMLAVGTAAIAARGMQADLNLLMFCFSLGIGRTLLAISSIYYGASDKEGLKRVFAYAVKLTVKVTIVVGGILFFVAPLVSGIYTRDPEVLELSVFGLRCLGLGLCFDMLSEAVQCYLQGIQNSRMVNILCFAERLFIPVLLAFVLGELFGSKGVMASFAVGKVVLLLGVFIYLCVRNRGIPKRLEDYMFLRPGFGGSESDNLNADITTMDDVMRESHRAGDFCRRHGVDERNSSLMALFIEEMAGNIVKHGRPRNKGGVCVDYRLFADGDNICLSLRDYCDAFDPMKYYEVNQNSSSSENLGIKMVMRLAKNIRYINTYNSNCLFIDLCTARG